MFLKLIVRCEKNHRPFCLESYDPELVDLYHLLNNMRSKTYWAEERHHCINRQPQRSLEGNSVFIIKDNDFIIGFLSEEEWHEENYSKCVHVSKKSFEQLLTTWKEYIVKPPEVFTITLDDKELAIFPGRPEDRIS